MTDKKMGEVFLLPLGYEGRDLVDGRRFIVSENVSEYHANHIAIAVNSHDKLVEALTDILNIFDCDGDSVGRVYDIASEALEDIKGEQE